MASTPSFPSEVDVFYGWAASVLVPSSNVTGIGSATSHSWRAGTFKTIGEAQDKVCPPHTVYQPEESAQRGV